jgi:hypothetical protein
MKRYNENARIIFDDEECVGRATDLTMPAPRRKFFVRVRHAKPLPISAPQAS